MTDEGYELARAEFLQMVQRRASRMTVRNSDGTGFTRTIGATVSPADAPCCDQVYICDGELECAVHGGFDVCCDRPDLHRPAEEPS